jgi:hypothetical protein
MQKLLAMENVYFVLNIQPKNIQISQNMHNHELHVQIFNSAENMQIL